MAQDGILRKSGSTPFPHILEIARTVEDAQTQTWCLMALRDMAPGVPYNTIDQWQNWWDEQSRLRAAASHN